MEIALLAFKFLKKIPVWLWILLFVVGLIVYQNHKIEVLEANNTELVEESADLSSTLKQTYEVIDELATNRNNLDAILTKRDTAIDDLHDDAKKLKRRIRNEEKIQVDSCYNSDMPDELYYELWKQEATENNN